MREASDQEVLELALIENIQRADLNVIEEAQAYARLAEEFNLRQEDIAQKVGKSRAPWPTPCACSTSNRQVQRWLTQERLSVGHAKVLLGLKAPTTSTRLPRYIIRQRSTVRAAEKLVSRPSSRAGNPRTGPGSRASRRRALWTAQWTCRRSCSICRTACANVSRHMSLLRHGDKKGSIEIEYYGNDDLERILAALGVKPESV